MLNARCLEADVAFVQTKAILIDGFGVDMVFSDEDRILVWTRYVLKSYGAKTLTKECLHKGRRLRGLNKLLKICKKLDCNYWFFALNWKHTVSFLFFFYSAAFLQNIDIIRKKYVIWLQIFSATILLNVIKIVNIWQSNHKSKRVNFLRPSVYAAYCTYVLIESPWLLVNDWM